MRVYIKCLSRRICCALPMRFPAFVESKKNFSMLCVYEKCVRIASWRVQLLLHEPRKARNNLFCKIERINKENWILKIYFGLQKSLWWRRGRSVSRQLTRRVWTLVKGTNWIYITFLRCKTRFGIKLTCVSDFVLLSCFRWRGRRSSISGDCLTTLIKYFRVGQKFNSIVDDLKEDWKENFDAENILAFALKDLEKVADPLSPGLRNLIMEIDKFRASCKNFQRFLECRARQT